VQGALEGGDARTIATLVGKGSVSVSMDGIAPGSYTSAQAARLLGGFFRATTDRSLEFRVCGSSGATSWAEAVLRYRYLEAEDHAEEHLLLEFCGSGDEAALCGIRSASPSMPMAS